MTQQSSVASNMSTLANAGSQSSLLSNMTTDSLIMTNNMSNLQINNVNNQQTTPPTNTPQPSPLPNPFLQTAIINSQLPPAATSAFPNQNQLTPLPSLFGSNPPPTGPILSTKIEPMPMRNQYQDSPTPQIALQQHNLYNSSSEQHQPSLKNVQQDVDQNR